MQNSGFKTGFLSNIIIKLKLDQTVESELGRYFQLPPFILAHIDA